MNLRELVGIEDEPYFKFNREERHLAAILFYLLNCSDNAERVLRSVDTTWKINPEEFGIYLEYSYPRDLWHRLDFTDWKKRTRDIDVDSVNKRKRDAIIAMLGIVGFDTTKLISLIREKEFNAFFIGPRGSSHYIQSPANWSLTQLVKSLPLEGDVNDLITACKVKWAFRVKPDLVIHADRGRALCIELKLESGEGSYPSSGIEKTLLKGKKIFAAKQTLPFPMTQKALQTFLMKDLLGFDCRFRFITRHPTSSKERMYWGDLLQLMDPLPNLPLYMQAALENFERSGVVSAPPSDDASDGGGSDDVS